VFVDLNPLIGGHGSKAHGYRERLSFNGNMSHTFASPTVDITIQPQVVPNDRNPSARNTSGLKNTRTPDKMIR
jgi:hypothetical protein